MVEYAMPQGYVCNKKQFCLIKFQSSKIVKDKQLTPTRMNYDIIYKKLNWIYKKNEQ